MRTYDPLFRQLLENDARERRAKIAMFEHELAKLGPDEPNHVTLLTNLIAAEKEAVASVEAELETYRA